MLDLLRRGPLTPIEALHKVNCMRLASRIDELKKIGHNITTEIVVNGKARYARYHLTG